MPKLYTFLKYFCVILWSCFVIAPFLWAISTSFKDFNSVTGGATYIPWLQFEPTLDGWSVLFKPGSQGGINIVGPYFNSIFVTFTASFISIALGTLAAYALSRYTFKAGFVQNNDITFFFISQRIMPPVVIKSRVSKNIDYCRRSLAMDFIYVFTTACWIIEPTKRTFFGSLH